MLFHVFEHDAINFKIVHLKVFYYMKLRKTNLNSKLVHAGEL